MRPKAARVSAAPIIVDAHVALIDAITEIEVRFELSVIELSKLLVDAAAGILGDGIRLERSQASKKKSKKRTS
jgi:hypothetical protein